MKSEFSRHIFRKNILEYQIQSNSVQWESNSMWTDGRTDMAKLIVAFRSFANGAEAQ